VYWGILGDSACFIATMNRKDNVWSAPRTVEFSGSYFDMEFCISPDGRQLFFTSENRPYGGKPRESADLWVVSQKESTDLRAAAQSEGEGSRGWSEPQPLGPGVNTELDEYSPSVSRSGTIYFYRRGADDPQDWDIYAARFTNGTYEEASPLPTPINSPGREFDPYIDPDERFLLFCAVDRSGGFGAADLYISHRQPDGSWGEAVNLGPGINSERWEFCPTISPDGQYLFFASNRRFLIEADDSAVTFDAKIKILDRELNSPGNGHSDFYWVKADLLKK
jgi:Tol biopolymer transport system component